MDSLSAFDQESKPSEAEALHITLVALARKEGISMEGASYRLTVGRAPYDGEVMLGGRTMLVEIVRTFGGVVRISEGKVERCHKHGTVLVVSKHEDRKATKPQLVMVFWPGGAGYKQLVEYEQERRRAGKVYRGKAETDRPYMVYPLDLIKGLACVVIEVDSRLSYTV